VSSITPPSILLAHNNNLHYVFAQCTHKLSYFLKNKKIKNRIEIEHKWIFTIRYLDGIKTENQVGKMGIALEKCCLKWRIFIKSIEYKLSGSPHPQSIGNPPPQAHVT
jgi:hypothetical protein